MVLCPTNRTIQRTLALLLVSILAFAATPVHGGDAATESRAPYVTEQEAVGLIGCAVAYQIVQGKDLCETYEVSARSLFDFDLDARLTTMVLLLQSEGGMIEANELSVSIQKPVGIQGARGPVPLLVTNTFDEDNSWPSWDEEGQILTVDVRVNHDAVTPQIAYQQKVRVCVGLFYNGAEVPDGYVPCGDL